MAQVRLEDARRVIAAAEKKAEQIGQPMNIAVADEGGNIVAHVRMDGAWIGSIDISQKKAYTSRAFDITTKDLATHSQSGGQFFGIHASNNGKIMVEERWQGRGRDRRQRRIGRTRPCCSCSRRCGVLVRLGGPDKKALDQLRPPMGLAHWVCRCGLWPATRNKQEKEKHKWQRTEVSLTWDRAKSR